MITDEQIKSAQNIFHMVVPKLHESVQIYKGVDEMRFGHVFKYLDKNKKCLAIWLDFPKLNEWQLRILFKHHKEVNHTFFINSGENFYRVGWKIKKPL